jgi:hypothetical protein
MPDSNDPKVREAKLRLVAEFEDQDVWIVLYLDATGRESRTERQTLKKARANAAELRVFSCVAYVVLAFNFAGEV